MGITDFSFSCCCEEPGSKLLRVEWNSLFFCFIEEYTFLYFQVIFCFFSNYHTEVNLFSFSWGDGDSIHLWMVLVNELFMCRISPCSVVKYHCSASLLLAWTAHYIFHNNIRNDLFWKIRGTWFRLVERNVNHHRSSAPTGVSPCSQEWETLRTTQPGSMGVQCEEGEPGATQKHWFLKALYLFMWAWLKPRICALSLDMMQN